MSLFCIPPCENCEHFDAENGACPAFEKEIPDDILTWENMHYEVRSDQVGEYVYTPIEEPWEYQQRFFPETVKQEEPA